MPDRKPALRKPGRPDRRLDEMRLAFMLLTRLPAGRLHDPATKLADAQWAYPLVGLPVGVIAAFTFVGSFALGAAPASAALIAIAAAILVTGALHHDGLADMADGIGGGTDRARRLEIMRDSRIGSYGVIALILALGLQAVAMAAMAGTGNGGFILAAFLLMAVASRTLMTAVLIALPPARADGLGQAATGQSNFIHLLPGIGLSVVAGLALGWPALLCVAGMLVVALVIALQADRHLGGQTGDVLGATQIATEVVGWQILAMWLGSL